MTDDALEREIREYVATIHAAPDGKALDKLRKRVPEMIRKPNGFHPVQDAFRLARVRLEDPFTWRIVSEYATRKAKEECAEMKENDVIWRRNHRRQLLRAEKAEATLDAARRLAEAVRVVRDQNEEEGITESDWLAMYKALAAFDAADRKEDDDG